VIRGLSSGRIEAIGSYANGLDAQARWRIAAIGSYLDGLDAQVRWREVK